MRVIKTLRLFKIYRGWSLAGAIKELGEYEPDFDDGPKTVSEVISLFGGEVVGLEESVDVHLLQEHSNLVAEHQLNTWMKEDGYEPMQLKHAVAIGLQYPD